MSLSLVDAMTPQREAFCMAYVRLGNASAAYREAYPKSQRWKPQTVHKRASELLADGEVLGRVQELKERVIEEGIADAIERQRFLTRVIRDESAEMRHRLKAVEVLGRAQGDFDSKKPEHTPVVLVREFVGWNEPNKSDKQ